MRGVCHAVRTLARRGDTEVVFPVHPSPAVRETVLPELVGVEGVHVCEPLDYLSLVHVLDSSDVVLTDSGGLQEEGPALGKPVLVLRDTTERPEAVEAGVAQPRRDGSGDDRDARVTTLLDDPWPTRRWPGRRTRSATAERASVSFAALSERSRLSRAA